MIAFWSLFEREHWSLWWNLQSTTLFRSNTDGRWLAPEGQLTRHPLEDVPLVEFMYLAFTCMPGESYHRWLGSLLRLFDVFQVQINFLVCWFCVSASGPHVPLFSTVQTKSRHRSKHFLRQSYSNCFSEKGLSFWEPVPACFYIQYKWNVNICRELTKTEISHCCAQGFGSQCFSLSLFLYLNLFLVWGKEWIFKKCLWWNCWSFSYILRMDWCVFNVVEVLCLLAVRNMCSAVIILLSDVCSFHWI